MSQSVLEKRVKIGNGGIPVYGIGTWTVNDRRSHTIIAEALRYNYRLIDTANLYENEQFIGEAIEESKVARDSLFVITKLDQSKHSYQGAIDSLKTSLEKLKLKYVDLYLIHTPKPGNIVDTWKGLIEAKKLGLAKHIGVSNFGIEHIKEIEKATSVLPEANEIELNVWNQQTEIVQYLRERNICIIGYCPVARGKLFGVSKTLQKIATKYNTDEAILALAWSVQNQFITIPKTETRIKSNVDNLNKFVISDEDLNELKKVDIGQVISSASLSMDLPFSDVK